MLNKKEKKQLKKCFNKILAEKKLVEKKVGRKNGRQKKIVIKIIKRKIFLAKAI